MTYNKELAHFLADMLVKKYTIVEAAPGKDYPYHTVQLYEVEKEIEAFLNSRRESGAK